MPITNHHLPIAYRGRRTLTSATVKVLTCSGAWKPLDPCFDLRNHSPTGFEWGYGGSGPAQLALALAASRLPKAMALWIYQRLKHALVAKFDSVWNLDGDRLDALLVVVISAAITQNQSIL